MVTSGSRSWLKRLLIVAAAFVMLASALPVQAEPGKSGDPAAGKARNAPTVRHAVRHDVSKALRTVKVKDHGKAGKATSVQELRTLPRVKKAGVGGSGSGGNSAPKLSAPGAAAPTVNAPITDFIANFEGVGNVDGVLPPDTNGDIGPNHYVQWVNLSIAVFDRAGNVLLGPIPGNALWEGFGGICETSNDGDPIVQYDHLADQWMVSQFALFGGDGNHQCIAVSQTGDPTGAWYRYDYLISATKLNDYPKFGVWPDAYYMSINQFDNNTFAYAGAGAVAFERSKMLLGQDAQMVYFDLEGANPGFGGQLPSDLDGVIPPPAGAPNLFAEQDDDAFGLFPTDRLSFWEFHVDWATPSNSTFGLDGQPNFFTETEPYDSDLCGFSRDCIPQPDTSQRLDAISDRLMYRLQYRNFGDHETLVANHTVDADGSDHAGIRWYELHGTGGSWGIHQQGTYAPDAASRWMGSAALDASGNLALGFSVSSDSLFPSIRIASRLATDPLGTLPQDELEMMTGGGSQTHPAARWGDYSSMSVDVDDCTLWYTQEYMAETSFADWHTRVGAFKLPTCATGPRGSVEGTVTKSDGGAPIQGARVRAGAATTFSDAAGHYRFVLPVGLYDVTASAYGFAPETATGLDVTDGAELTQDFALDALPMVNVSGTVRDGSGHGYPLYASIDVGGAPIAPLYTDPLTGDYAVTLFQETPYTFEVAARLPGYQAANVTVTFDAATADLDFDLLVDQQACTAPGYRAVIGGLFEPFATTTLPAGWSILQFDGAGGATWRLDDPAGRGNLTGGDGAFAIVDSDFAGPDGHQDTALQSPIVDLTGIASPAVIFNTDFFDFPPDDEFGRVELSTDFGRTWAVVWDTAGQSYRGPRVETVPIPTAAGRDGIVVRFHYGAADFAWWWQVDSVVIGTRDCVVTPGGGLVIGQVFDGNTAEAVDGATVTSTDAPPKTDSATSGPTPDDPAVGDGFYMLFSSLTGSHPFTAAKKGYQSGGADVAVVEGGVVRQDFTLGAGKLSVTPGELVVPLAMGDTATRELDLSNVGTAPAAFELKEANAGREILKPRGAPLVERAGSYSSHRLHEGAKPVARNKKLIRPPRLEPWLGIADYPTSIMDNAVVAIDGRLYSFGGLDDFGFVSAGATYDPAANSWSPISGSTPREKPAAAVIDGKVYVVGGWSESGSPIGELEIYDPASDSWSSGAPVPVGYAAATAVVVDGLMYVIGGCSDSWCGWTDVFVYDPAADSWGSAAAYPEPTSWQACGVVDGLIYCAGGVSDDFGESTGAYVYDPGADAWSPVASLPATAWAAGFTAAAGMLLISGGVTDGFSTVTNVGWAYDPASDSWGSLPNSNNTVYRGGSACGFYKIGGSIGGFSPVPFSELLPDLDDCDAGTDVPWLSEAPTTGSIDPAGQQTIVVSFDATVPEVDQPGTYRARIAIKEDTPYAAEAVVVTMNVSPPATWGKLVGTISGLAVCDRPGAPLAGARVLVDGSTSDFDLKTDANGAFAVWMDAANGPVSLTISANGYVGATVPGVAILAGQTTTQDADLRLDAPCGAIEPLAIDVVLPTGQTADVTLDLTNAGAAPFDFGPIAETPLSLTGSQPPAAPGPSRPHSAVKTGPTAMASMTRTRGAAAPAPNAPPWFGGAPVPGGIVRYAPAQCDGDPDHFYVFGGVNGFFETTSAAWRYDAVSNTWAALAAMPEGFEGSAGACDAGLIHVLGGSGTDAHFIYDIGSDSWSSGAPLPRPVEGAAAAAWSGRVYLIGGDDDFFPGNGVSGAVDIYDVATDTWIGSGANMPTPTANMGYAQVGSTVYVAGGWVDYTDTDGAINTGATQAYDLIGDAWASGPDLGTPRADLALAATGSALYAIGGDGPGPDFFEPTAIAERLPTGTWPGGAWAAIDSLPIATQSGTAGYCTLGVGSAGAEVWAVGGFRGDNFSIDGLTFWREAAGEGCPTIRSDVPWLSEDPLSGTVPGDGARQVNVRIDTAGLEPGVHVATLFIPTTDPRLGEVRIPVRLTVGATKILISVEKDGTVAGVAAANEDIVAVRGDGTGEIYFDGSDVGLSKYAIDAFSKLDDDSLLFSFSGAATVPGISGKVDGSDIVRFVPTTIGATTAGTFSLYFDGSDVGLTAAGDNVDALDVQHDGSLLISTSGTTKPAAGITGDDSDVLRFEPTALGATTAGTWSIYLDMGNVGLTTNDEDLDALMLWNGHVGLSTTGNLSVPGLTAQDDDVVIFDPTATGAGTAGTWDPVPFLDGASIGIAGNDLTAIALP